MVRNSDLHNHSCNHPALLHLYKRFENKVHGGVNKEAPSVFLGLYSQNISRLKLAPLTGRLRKKVFKIIGMSVLIGM